MKLEHLALIAGGLYLLSKSSAASSPPNSIAIVPAPDAPAAPIINAAIQSSVVTPTVAAQQIKSITSMIGGGMGQQLNLLGQEEEAYKYAYIDLQAAYKQALDASKYQALSNNLTWTEQVTGGNLPYSSPQVQSLITQLNSLLSSIKAPFQTELNALNAAYSMIPSAQREMTI